jgi:hypothetical protein
MAIRALVHKFVQLVRLKAVVPNCKIYQWQRSLTTHILACAGMTYSRLKIRCKIVDSLPSLGCIIAFVLMTASIAKAQAVPKMKMITDIPATNHR